jgi:hypothetical protein
MNLSFDVGLVIFALLLLVLVPARPCHRRVLRLLEACLWLLLVAIVVASGVFHVAPDLAPPALADVLDRLLGRLDDQLPGLLLFRPIVSPWSIYAVLAVISGLSLLHRLDMACRRADRAARHARALRRP